MNIIKYEELLYLVVFTFEDKSLVRELRLEPTRDLTQVASNQNIYWLTCNYSLIPWHQIPIDRIVDPGVVLSLQVDSNNLLSLAYCYAKEPQATQQFFQQRQESFEKFFALYGWSK